MLVSEQVLKAACQAVSVRWTLSGEQVYRLYKEVISTLEPSPRAQALEEGDLNARLKAKGMYSIDEMMGTLPVDKWRVQSGMTDLKFFGEWLERKTREYLTMKAAYDAGDKDESDELYEWVLAHYGAFHDVLVNFRAALSSQPGAEGSFQDRVKPWMLTCFGEGISNDKLERCDRFIEEALELVQAIGYSPERAHALVDYVFNRDIGEPHQEVGGVMVTLAALCLASGLDMSKSGEDELARIWTKVEKIRAKQAAKPIGSALPIALPVSQEVSE